MAIFSFWNCDHLPQATTWAYNFGWSLMRGSIVLFHCSNWLQASLKSMEELNQILCTQTHFLNRKLAHGHVLSCSADWVLTALIPLE